MSRFLTRPSELFPQRVHWFTLASKTPKDAPLIWCCRLSSPLWLPPVSNVFLRRVMGSFDISERDAHDRTSGHSLGAAVALLDAAMLRMQLSSDVAVESVVFGQPRVGNQQFADMIDGMVRKNPRCSDS